MEKIQEINNIEELYEITNYGLFGLNSFEFTLYIDNKWRIVLNNDNSAAALPYIYIKVNEGFKCRYRTWGE